MSSFLRWQHPREYVLLHKSWKWTIQIRLAFTLSSNVCHLLIKLSNKFARSVYCTVVVLLSRYDSLFDWGVRAPDSSGQVSASLRQTVLLCRGRRRRRHPHRRPSLLQHPRPLRHETLLHHRVWQRVRALRYWLQFRYLWPHTEFISQRNNRYCL